MWMGEVTVDGNGIVLFDPEVVRRFRPSLGVGHDLFHELTTTDAGEAALRDGVFVPVLAIDDAGYEVVIREDAETSVDLGDAVCSNGLFPLQVVGRLVVADLAVLRHWLPEVGWLPTNTSPGSYGVRIVGRRRVEHRRLTSCGYEFVLQRASTLPVPTGDPGHDMRILDWWNTKDTLD